MSFSGGFHAASQNYIEWIPFYKYLCMHFMYMGVLSTYISVHQRKKLCPLGLWVLSTIEHGPSERAASVLQLWAISLACKSKSLLFSMWVVWIKAEHELNLTVAKEVCPKVFNPDYFPQTWFTFIIVLYVLLFHAAQIDLELGTGLSLPPEYGITYPLMPAWQWISYF